VQPTERKAPCPCGSGRRYKNCCWARDRAREAPREAARAAHRRVDDVLTVLLPLVESRGEHKIACGPGCSACCNSFVRCSRSQALLVADWLKQPENAPVLRRFTDKLGAWRERAGALAAELDALLDENRDWERYDRLALEYGLRGNMCPLNDEGRCEIYPVRPTICRSVHVLETAEYCTPGRGQKPKVLTHPELEAAVRDANADAERPLRAIPESIAWALANS
jgi:hypothetical protein